MHLCTKFRAVRTICCAFCAVIAKKSISCRLSVCLSVTLVDCGHIGWNSSKIISQLGSLRCSLSVDPTSWIYWLAWSTAAAAPPPFRPGNPALCGDHPLVTPYYCRLGDLLCFVFIVSLLYFSVNCVISVFLQYFDTVGWVL